MARCTGKTNVQNLEPEDLKTITIAALGGHGNSAGRHAITKVAAR